MDLDIIMQQVVSHLNKHSSSEDVHLADDNFVEKLFVNNDVRKNILKSLISLFSEDYRNDLERTFNVDTELAKKINELGFCTENRFKFVMGQCSKEEQQIVYNKIFKALHFVFTAQESSQSTFSSPMLMDELLFKLGIETSFNKLKKLQKSQFNLKRANQNLDLAHTMIEDVSQLMDRKKHLTPLTPKPKLDVKEIEESNISELNSSANLFKHIMMERHVPSPLECSNENFPPGELGNAVRELHQHLNYFEDCSRTSCPEGIEVNKGDQEKILVQAVETEKDLAVSKCFSNDFY